VSPLRLLYVGPINSPHVEDLAIAMRERGHEVEAAGQVWGGLPASSLPEHGVPTHVMSLPAILWMRRLLRRFRPDVVHTHWMPFATLAVLAGGRRIVSSAWGSDIYGVSRRQRLMIRLALRRVAVAVADSADLVRCLEELGPRSLRTLLVNWGVDLEAFTVPEAAERAELKARFGFGPGPLVLSARGLKEVYNPEIVVDAFERLRHTVPDAQLALKHGGGTEELVRPEWHAAEGVRILGRLDYGELTDLFRAADVTVSLASSDSSPRSVWEAMAAGSATVVSDLPWVHELIVDGRDALVVPPQAAAVATAVARLLREDDLRSRLAASARELVEQHRDREIELGRLEACYRELAER
jgi:glycosyltransferase involved in cell wall biosynthesis